jgi:subtilisin family serine protease
VIDTGIDLRHPDLAAGLWTNRREIPGNGVDDDGNGYVDDVHGYDFVNHDGDPSDDNGHGTAVAGALGARTSNDVGIAGVAGRPQIRLMALKALDRDAGGGADAIAAAVRYAVANGARIVNASVNGGRSTPDLEAAFAAARAAGVLVVASAGNAGHDLSADPSYPAAYPYDNVVTVGSVGAAGRLSSFSDRGARVDELAPGERIMTTAPGGGYAFVGGTSFATAQVTGALALLASAYPTASAAALRGALAAVSRPAGMAEVPQARVLDLRGGTVTLGASAATVRVARKRATVRPRRTRSRTASRTAHRRAHHRKTHPHTRQRSPRPK